jgi:hypothetical protein
LVEPFKPPTPANMSYLETRIRHLEDRRKYVLEQVPAPIDKLNATQAQYRYDFQVPLDRQMIVLLVPSRELCGS